MIDKNEIEKLKSIVKFKLKDVVKGDIDDKLIDLFIFAEVRMLTDIQNKIFNDIASCDTIKYDNFGLKDLKIIAETYGVKIGE